MIYLPRQDATGHQFRCGLLGVGRLEFAYTSGERKQPQKGTEVFAALQEVTVLPFMQNGGSVDFHHLGAGHTPCHRHGMQSKCLLSGPHIACVNLEGFATRGACFTTSGQIKG